MPAAGQQATGWSTTLTVGNMYAEGQWDWPEGEYTETVVESSEWERGYRRQHCVMQLDDTDPDNREDRTGLDTCYGSIVDSTFAVDGTTYEIAGVYHYTADRNDQLSLDFTSEVDLTPLLGKTFTINGVDFRVSDRHFPSGVRGSGLSWAAPEWTIDMGWTVGGSITVALEGATPESTGTQIAAADPPTVSGAPAVSDAGDDGEWTPDETVEVTLTFSEAVTLDTTGGTPSVGISLGGTAARSAAYLRGSGTAELVFGYTLTDTDGSHTSMVATHNSLALNGGTIRSQSDVDAELAHNSAAVQAAPAHEAEQDDFTARFENMPQHHDGASAFIFELHLSENPQLSYRTVQGGLLEVSGADITKASRLDRSNNMGWTVTAVPTGSGDIAISLPVRACDAANAVCVDGRPLAQGLSATVRARPFTGTFANVPAEHDGENAFTLEFHLSEAPRGLGWRTVKGHLFDVSGGAIEKARRIGTVRNRGWELTVAPRREGGCEPHAARHRLVHRRAPCVHRRRAHARRRGFR